jgi:PhzF family phenazine biosynthesis protein
MTTIPFFQVDAFAEAPLTGNPAAVMPLERWLDDGLMQAIAAENNLSETAFTVPIDAHDVDFELRWFTPAVEVDLCGHATLAAGHILMSGHQVRFRTRSGVLTVSRHEDLLELDLPAAKLTEGRATELCDALGVSDRTVWSAEGFNDSVIIPLESEAEVRAVSPDFARLNDIRRMAIVTASRTSGAWPSSLRPATSRTSPAGCSSPTSASTRIR